MMVRRSRDDELVAVLDAPAKPARSPAEIAAQVEQATVNARREEVRADVLRWREIVQAVAEGHEPSAADIRDIGAIAHRLRLPADSVAIATGAIKRAAELEENAERFKREAAEVQATKPQLVAEIKAAEQRLLDLRAKLNLAIVAQGSMAEVVSAAGHHRNQHPMLWGDIEHVVGEVCRHDAAMGQNTLDALKHRPQVVEGNTFTAWS